MNYSICNTVRISAPDNTVYYGPKTDRIDTVYGRKYPVFTTFTARFRIVNDTVLIDLGIIALTLMLTTVLTLTLTIVLTLMLTIALTLQPPLSEGSILSLHLHLFLCWILSHQKLNA
jgi:cellulose synthase/poly-beta-1,6-N-acetylglucosamine synthase-like glycosyltransferase